MMRTLSAVMALAMTLAATLILGMASPLLGANALLMLGVLLFCILYQQVIIHLIKSE